MQTKRRWSKLLAITLCLQMILSCFSTAGVVYAAEEAETEPRLLEETVQDELEEVSTLEDIQIKTTEAAKEMAAEEEAVPAAESPAEKEEKEKPAATEQEVITTSEKAQATPSEETTTRTAGKETTPAAGRQEETETQEQPALTETETTPELSPEGETSGSLPETTAETQTETVEESKKEESSEEKTEGLEESTEETATEDEETEDETEEAEQRWNGSPISERAAHNGVTVKVSAPAGSFPEGTELRINPIGAAQTDEIALAIGEGTEAVAFDIAFYSTDGNKVQPRDGYYVDVYFEITSGSVLADHEGEGATLHAYHMADSGNIEKLASVDAPEEGSAEITLSADNFSPYVIVKEAAEEPVRQNRDAASSTNLADFLVNVACNAPTDENGNYVINPYDSYEITFSFRENESLQFDNEADLVYVLPEGLIVPDASATSFDIDIVDGDGAATMLNNTFEVADGRLIVRFNQNDPNIDRLKALANVAFQVELSVQFDESAGSIVFNSDIEKDFVFSTSADLTIDKAVSYNSESGTAEYTITVISEGHNQNVVIQDIITGTALTLNHDVTVNSSVSGDLTPEIDYDTISNGFSFAVEEMQNKEVLTIRCTADVDYTKISSNGTVEQTKNIARVTSEQVPDGKETSADFAGQVRFQRVNKTAAGDPVQTGENQYEQAWTIRVNEDHKMQMGGTWIYDWIVQNSRPFMAFGSDGITVNVTFEDGRTETREVPQSDLKLYENSNGIYGWGYLTPESDGKASYEITCKSKINTEGALGDLTLVNGAQVYGSYDDGQTTIGVIGENDFGIQKEAVGTTATESEWKITVTVPGSGLNELHIVDDCPKLEGRANIDYLLEGSMEVDGLLEGESWSVEASGEGRSFVVRFFKDDQQGSTSSGVLPTHDGKARDIVIRFKTEVDQEWLNLAAENGYSSSTLKNHRNYACAWSDSYRTQTVNATVVPYKPTMVKHFAERSDAEIDGVTYPVFRYTISLSGPREDGVVIHDAFNTEYLQVYEADGVGIRGGRSSSNLTNTDGTASANATDDGIDIIVSRFPKNSDGDFYPFYELSYSLIVKDEDALMALNSSAAESSGGIYLENTASWNDIFSSRAVNYTYFPYVDKELVTGASADNDYIAEFKLIINQYAQDLDPASDTLNIQDVLSSNLRFVQDSLSVTPEAEGMKTQFDSEANALIFTDVPDNTRFEITYKARVLGKGNVTYSNTVKLGNYEKTVKENVKVESGGSGTGSNPSITLVKRDSENVTAALAGATFQLYYVDNGTQVPVTDKNGSNVTFTTGEDGSVLIAGNQNILGWTLWEGRTYQLMEVTAPVGYEINHTPTEFILSGTPSSQMEYDLTGDSVTAWDTKIKTEVSVSKQWTGPELEEVTVYLKVGENVIRTAVLSKDTNWQYTFTDLDKYDANGEEIQYKVEEELLEGYRGETNGNMADGFVITNTNTSTTSVSVKKEWVGASADSTIVNLLADKTPIDEVELSGENEWTHTFENLPRYDAHDGHEIEYGIKEEALEGFKPQYSGNAGEGFTVTNTNIEKIEIPVTKTWIGPAPGSLQINLFADGEIKETAALTADNHWSHIFAQLPKYDPEDGHVIVYSVEEEPLANYKGEMNGSVEEGIVFTNRNTETIAIPVEKKWVGPAADEVTIRLIADGEQIESATLTAETEWKHVFENLNKYSLDDGHVIQYLVREDPIEGYAPGYKVEADGGYIITNTITGKVSVPVTKTWIGPAIENVTIKLLADGKEIDTIVLSDENNWQHTFVDLEQYNEGTEITYTVEEQELTGYDFKITGDQTGYVITNTNTATVDIPVEKKWIGPGRDSVLIRLTADGEEAGTITLTQENEWKHVFEGLRKYDPEDGHEIRYDLQEDPVTGYETSREGSVSEGVIFVNTNTETLDIPVEKKWIGPAADKATVRLIADGEEKDIAVLDAEGEWKYIFRDLPKYDSADGHEIEYKLNEDEIGGFESKQEGTAAEGITFINTNKETMDIPVVKKWIGDALASVTVRLFADGVESQNATLTSEDDWKHTFTGLQKYDVVDGHEIQYQIKEEPVEGYITGISGTAMDGYTITNTITGKVSVPVTKVWIGPAAESVTVELLADGKKADSIRLNEDNHWQHTFADLEKYKDGKEISYTVREEAVDHYSTEISGNAAEGYIIRNTNTETIDIPVIKTWVGKPADHVTVRLMADEKEAGNALLDEESGWHHIFTGLPKYDTIDGHEIRYTITEDAVDGYNMNISGSASKGFQVTNTITGKVSFSVTKKWVGPATSETTIYLLADGKTVEEVVLNKNNNWQHMFTGLDQYKEGKEIRYSIKEKALAGYDTRINGTVTIGFTVTNINIEKQDISVEKKWVGKEGGSVTIRLYADGEEMQKSTLSKANGWSTVFDGLPVYDEEDGHKITYSISEDEIAGYTSKITGSADKGFTVTNTKKGTPEKPTTPSTPNNESPRTTRTPKTGDETNLALWLALLCVSGGVLIFVLFRKKRRSGTE